MIKLHTLVRVSKSVIAGVSNKTRALSLAVFALAMSAQAHAAGFNTFEVMTVDVDGNVTFNATPLAVAIVNFIVGIVTVGAAIFLVCLFAKVLFRWLKRFAN